MRVCSATRRAVSDSLIRNLLWESTGNDHHASSDPLTRSRYFW
jgi:hypothetical protein